MKYWASVCLAGEKQGSGENLGQVNTGRRRWEILEAAVLNMFLIDVFVVAFPLDFLDQELSFEVCIACKKFDCCLPGQLSLGV